MRHPSPSRPGWSVTRGLIAGLLLLSVGASRLHAEAKAGSFPESVPPGSPNTAIEPAARVDKLDQWTARFQARLRYAEAMDKAHPVQVVFDGDSITDLFRERAKELWQGLETTYHAIDYGISGDRTENLLYRLDHGQAQGLHPRLVFLMIGHNNIPYNTPEQIYDGVAAIIGRYQAICPDATIILQATFPSKEPDSKWRKAITALNKLLPRLAQPDKVVFIDFGDRFLSPDGTISKDIMPDGTHPTDKGYAIWATAIQPVLERYFPAARTAAP